MAYELMQANRVDASQSFFSLDDIYYFGGQNAHDRLAVLPHEAQAAQDVSFKVGHAYASSTSSSYSSAAAPTIARRSSQVGDLIGVAGNHWNGYGRGTNRRTNAVSYLPILSLVPFSNITVPASVLCTGHYFI